MRYLACLFALLLAALPAAAQDKPEVDLALAMAIDISGSIDPDEARLQREGYVLAFRDPIVVKAILGGAHDASSSPTMNGRTLSAEAADRLDTARQRSLDRSLRQSAG